MTQVEIVIANLDKIEQWAKEGLRFEAMAKRLGICRESITTAKNRNTEVHDAIVRGWNAGGYTSKLKRIEALSATIEAKRADEDGKVHKKKTMLTIEDLDRLFVMVREGETIGAIARALNMNACTLYAGMQDTSSDIHDTYNKGLRIRGLLKREKAARERLKRARMRGLRRTTSPIRNADGINMLEWVNREHGGRLW